jgi:hypothetical protein
MPIEAVRAGFVSTFESPAFALEEQREDPQMLVSYLHKRKLPCPGKFPRGLENVKAVGCRELVIDGKRGSLLCFKVSKCGVVHLVVFQRKDVTGELPPKSDPEFSQNGGWASARWADGDKVFLMLSRAEVGKLTELF